MPSSSAPSAVRPLLALLLCSLPASGSEDEDGGSAEGVPRRPRAAAAAASGSGSATTDCDPSGSTSASGSVDPCATPPPTSHLQTLLMWDCEGNFYVLPDNPVFSVKFNVPMLPRLFDAAFNGVKKHVEAHADGGAQSNGDPAVGSADFKTWFLRRFHPVYAALYGHRIWKGGKLGSGDGSQSSPGLPFWGALDNMTTFTRDLVKLYEALTGGTSFEMPDSCPYYYWDKGDSRYKGKCQFTHELMEIGADLQVSIRKCPRNDFFFQMSVGCQGGGCEVFRSCTSDSDCKSPGHLGCFDFFEWIDPKSPQDGPKWTEQTVYEFLTDKFYLYNKAFNASTDTCSKFTPRYMLKDFVDKFAKYFVNSPEGRTDGTQTSSCSTHSSGAPLCKVCLPVHTYAIEASVNDFAGRWKEKNSDYPKDRLKYSGKKGTDGCAITSRRVFDKYTPLQWPEAYANPAALLNPAPYWNVSTPPWRSPLARASQLYFVTQKQKVGGYKCSADADCRKVGSEGICITADTFCTLAEAYCESVPDSCTRENKTNACVRTGTDNYRKCACYVLHMDGDNHALVHGEKCEKKMWIGNPDSNMFGPMFTAGLHAYRPKYDPLIDWHGKSADGEDPFKVRDHWAKWPSLQGPSGESHVASVQCDGVVHLFMNTPYSMRMHWPMLPDIVKWFSKWNLKTWQCRAPSIDVSAYRVANTLPWRPEGWLYAKMYDSGPSTTPPSGFDSFLSAFFSQNAAGLRGITGPSFDIRTFEQVLRGPSTFTLSNWLATLTGTKKYLGVKWNGMQDMLGTDWEAMLRFEECDTSEDGAGMVRTDLTCNGRACTDYFRFAIPCNVAHGEQCPGEPSHVTCRDVLSGFWKDDWVSQYLWGADRTAASTYYTQDSVCPALENFGKSGSTSKMKDKKALYKMVAGLWDAARMADCSARDEAACWRDCGWETNSDQCLGGGPSPVIEDTYATQKMRWCMPHVYPFFDALVTSRGKSSAVIGEPNSSEIYGYSEAPVPSRSSQEAAIFDFSKSTTLVARPASYDVEEMYVQETSESTSHGIGTSFIIVMIAMGVIICMAAFTVWFRYVRVTPEEKERQGRLHGLTFNWKAEDTKFGRDYMYPDMCREWLPDGAAYAEEWEERMNAERPTGESAQPDQTGKTHDLSVPDRAPTNLLRLPSASSHANSADEHQTRGLSNLRLPGIPDNVSRTSRGSGRLSETGSHHRRGMDTLTPKGPGPGHVSVPSPLERPPHRTPPSPPRESSRRTLAARSSSTGDAAAVASEAEALVRARPVPPAARTRIEIRETPLSPQRSSTASPRALEVDDDLPPGPPPPAGRTTRVPASRERDASRGDITIADVATLVQRGGAAAVPGAIDAYHSRRTRP